MHAIPQFSYHSHSSSSSRHELPTTSKPVVTDVVALNLVWSSREAGLRNNVMPIYRFDVVDNVETVGHNIICV
jgi:hypothetical protein